MPETGVTRLQHMFATAREEGRAVLLPYMTAGLPSPRESAGLFLAMAGAGADGFEVGIPYADPLMDGPVIQAAGAAALAAGTSLDGSLEIVAEVTKATNKPVIVMTYVNPVMRVGPGEFARRVAAAGACGIIVADLPADEAADIAAAMSAEGLGMVLFAAPTTDDARLASIAATRPVFVYGVADLGVTGVRSRASDRVVELAKRVKQITDVPLVMGVGISTPAQARVAASVSDGVIVGSALVKLVMDAATAEEAAASLRTAVKDLAAAVRR